MDIVTADLLSFEGTKFEPYEHNKRDGYTLLFAFLPILFMSVAVIKYTNIDHVLKIIVTIVIKVFVFLEFKKLYRG